MRKLTKKRFCGKNLKIEIKNYSEIDENLKAVC